MGANPTSEHYSRRILPGDVPTVRLRLIAAMERLGYEILDDDENLVRGRREPRGWATAWSSADVLEYEALLIVRLRPQGEHATKATFDYAVKHPHLSRGEKEILTREAEAISALAMVRAIDRICSSCGTESTDDSRYCRRCGARLVSETVELEVLRMLAEIRAGYTSIVSGFWLSAVGLGLTSIAVVVLISSGVIATKGILILLALGAFFTVCGLSSNGFGWNRVSRSLMRPPMPKENSPDLLVPDRPPLSLVSPANRPPSVTERTTNLLTEKHDSYKTGEFASREQ